MASSPYTLSDLRARHADILSDVDLMVDMDPDRKLTGFAYFGELDRLEQELTALLECDVDIVDAAGLAANAKLLASGARVRENMMRDAVAL
jgi:predicted nucleotidyltransferase